LVSAQNLFSREDSIIVKELTQGSLNENVFTFSLMWVVVVAWYCASPVPASRPLQQDTPAKQDAKDAGTSAKNAAQETGSATKKETKKAVDGSDASKKPETTPSQDIERGIIDERCDEENRECHKERNEESREQVRREDRRRP
jgi:hypothetical protein